MDDNVAFARAMDRLDELDVARRLAAMLHDGDRALGLSADWTMPLRARCMRILRAAQKGGLDPRIYRLAWMLGKHGAGETKDELHATDQ